MDKRVNDIVNNRLEVQEVLNQLDDAIDCKVKYEDELIEYKSMIPLQTQMSLAERWNVSRQTVANWARRHSDFPEEVEGIIEQTAKTPKLYAMADVERYEKLRGLSKWADQQ